MKTRCRRCKVAESTGTLIELCDPCFEWFDKQVSSNLNDDGMYVIPDAELEFLSDLIVDRTRN